MDSTCTGCGVTLEKQHILILRGYRRSKPLISKESIEKLDAYCMKCGVRQIEKSLTDLGCAIWIGMPVRSERNVAINFIPHQV